MVNTPELMKYLKGLDSQKTVKGFTLVELLIVVIIMGILAAIALPNLLSQVSIRVNSLTNNVSTKVNTLGMLPRGRASWS